MQDQQNNENALSVGVKYDERVLSKDEMLEHMNNAADDISKFILDRLGIPTSRGPGEGMPDVLFRPAVVESIISAAMSNLVGYVRSQTVDEDVFVQMSDDDLVNGIVHPFVTLMTQQTFDAVKRYQTMIATDLKAKSVN